MTRPSMNSSLLPAALIVLLCGACNLDENGKSVLSIPGGHGQHPVVPPTMTGGDAGSDSSAGPINAWIAFDSDGGTFNRDIYVIRPDGTERRRLTRDPSVEAQPAFSRDGTRLAFASDRNGGVMQIYVMDLATGTATLVTHAAGGAHDPAFTMDGTRVGYRSGISVFTARLDGTDERQITDGMTCCTGGPFGPPVFTSDGKLTIYDDYNAIYATDGMSRRTIVKPTTGEQSHPALSPDGLTVALQATCLGDNAGRSVWAAPATGTTDYICTDGRRLSEHGFDATHPSWGPDNLVVWGSVAGGNNSSGPVSSALVVWQESTFRTLTSGNADDRNPSWSPTGTAIGNW